MHSYCQTCSTIAGFIPPLLHSFSPPLSTFWLLVSCIIIIIPRCFIPSECGGLQSVYFSQSLSELEACFFLSPSFHVKKKIAT